jgi:ABC-type amino acid transport substrate-binding protein
MFTRRHLLASCSAALPAGPALAAAPLVVLVDASIEMPQARIEGAEVTEGFQYQLALELGRRLGRPVRFRVLPRKRLAGVLADGEEADLACNYMPAWLAGPLLWSRPVFERSDVLITARSAPPPQRLQELAGRPIGTIAGFSYPELETALGSGFVRDDAPNLESSLKKLGLGRVQHAVVGRASLDYQARLGHLNVELHPPLVVSRQQTACALSPRSSVSLASLDAALAGMLGDGSIQRLLDRYR